MAGTFKIKFTVPKPDFAAQLAGVGERLQRAISATVNMIASMLLEAGRSDIGSAGNFGQRWTDGLHVAQQGSGGNMKLFFTHDIPYASIFETGGTIQGRPLLWIPISGTDAAGVRASAFPGGLFSARYPRKSGPPLLFSIADKKPRYFGVESVTIPQKFHLTDDVTSVMANFRAVFDSAWASA